MSEEKEINGNVIFTISAQNKLQEYANKWLEETGILPKTQDAEFEIIEPKQIENKSAINSTGL